MVEIKDKNLVRWPKMMEMSSFKRNMTKYYQFHKDYEHDTNDYHMPKEEIEFFY